MSLASTVVNQNRSRDDRRRSYPVILLNDRVHVVRRQHLEGGALRGLRDCVGVLPHIERAVGSLLVPVFADGLGNCEDVRFVKCAAQGRATVSAGAEAHSLVWIIQVGAPLEIFLLQASHVHQQLFWSRFACQRRNAFPRQGLCFYGTGHGSTFQISLAYSAIERSLENLPELATFKSAFSAHAPGSA